MSSFTGPVQLRRFTAVAAAASTYTMENGRAFWVEKKLYRGDGVRTVQDIYAQDIGGEYRGAYQAGINLAYLDTVSHLDQIWEWQGAGETLSTIWATDSSNFVAIGASPVYIGALIAAVQADVDAVTAKQPTVYEVDISSAGSSSNEVNQFTNTFTTAQLAPGRYTITADSGTPFTAGKTKPSFTLLGNAAQNLTPEYEITSTSVISIRWIDPALAEVDPSDGFSAFIRRYS